jgi:translation initiation factor IF-1
MKTEVLEIKGTITKVLPNTMYRAKLDKVDTDILCYLCGKKNKK